MLWMLLALGCAIFPRIEKFVAQRPYDIGLERQHLDIPEGQMAYWTGGNPDGEPLIWLHGFGGDAMWAWVRNIPSFTKDYRIIAPDLIGFGDSYGEPSLDAQVEAVINILEREGIEQAHVVALSYGGFVALKMLPTGHVESLVLVGVGGLSWTETEFTALAQRFDVPDLESLFVPSSPEDTRRLVDICFHLPMVLMPKSFDAQLYQNVFGKYPEPQRALLSNLQTEAAQVSIWTNQMPESIPALLIVGRQDPIFSIQDVQDLSRLLQGSVKTYRFADHVPQVGYRRRFNRDLRLFLSQNATMPLIDSENVE